MLHIILPQIDGENYGLSCVHEEIYVKEGTNRSICLSSSSSTQDDDDATFRPAFVEHMVTLLGFTDVSNPPVGMLTFLLEALVGGEQKKGHTSFLFPESANRTLLF